MREKPDTANSGPPTGAKVYCLLWAKHWAKDVASIIIGSSQCEEESGSDGVDADTHLGEVNSQPLGEVADGSLGTAVSRDLGERSEGVHAGDIDDSTGSAFSHAAGENLGGEQGSEEVQIEDETDSGGIQIEEGGDAFDFLFKIFGEEIFFAGGAFGVVAAGAVDEDVAGTEFRFDDSLGSLEAVEFQNIGSQTDGFAAGSVDFICHFFGIFLAQIEDCDFCAVGSKSFCHDTAKDTTAAGNDGNFSGKVYFHNDFPVFYC